MSKNSIKNQIIDYVLLNIKSSIWMPGSLIPSENSLAIKFNCSRLTSRSALQHLITKGAITSLKGKGYFVSDASITKAMDSSKIAYDDICKVEATKEIIISSNYANKLLKNHFKVKKSFDLANALKITKEYFTEKGIIIHQMTFINSKVYKTTGKEDFSNYLVEILASKNILLDKYVSNLTYEKNPKLDKKAKEIGWIGQYPVYSTITYQSKKWVTFSVKILSPERINIAFNRTVK